MSYQSSYIGYLGESSIYKNICKCLKADYECGSIAFKEKKQRIPHLKKISCHLSKYFMYRHDVPPLIIFGLVQGEARGIRLKILIAYRIFDYVNDFFWLQNHTTSNGVIRLIYSSLLFKLELHHHFNVTSCFLISDEQMPGVRGRMATSLPLSSHHFTALWKPA